MPTWGNTDNHNQKPKFDVVRETREVVQLTTANTTNSGNTVITFVYNDGAGNNVANIGVAVNSWVYFAGNGATGTAVSSNGYPGLFKSNNQVKSVNGNNVVLGTAVNASIASGTIIEFDSAIVYNSNKVIETTYNADTVLVTQTRIANNTVSMGNLNPGWVHIQKTTNGGADQAVRYRSETLVALASPTASNTLSGNTSWGQAFTGV